MDDAERYWRYWYSFRLNAWFSKSGTQLHSNTMEPIVRGSDYDSALARIRQLESQLAACKIARDGFTAASDTPQARIRELEAALRAAKRLFDRSEKQ